jgi:hypothetical protein
LIILHTSFLNFRKFEYPKPKSSIEITDSKASLIAQFAAEICQQTSSVGVKIGASSISGLCDSPGCHIPHFYPQN